MKLARLSPNRVAFTLIEVLAAIALLLVILTLFLPSLNRGPRKSPALACLNNLREIGIGFWMYQGDHGKFSWQITTNKAEAELVTSDIAADYFLKLSPYLPLPRFFVCPTDKARLIGNTNFFGFNNTNLSYFLGLDATTNNPSVILSGDRHLAFNNQAATPGLLFVTNNTAIRWTKELHPIKDQTRGVLLFVDGHCEVVQDYKLPQAFKKQALATNRLVIP